MINLFWRVMAKVVARPAITAYLIERAKCTPYQHVMSDDGQDMYMGRWWLFNPCKTHKPKHWWCPWSFRIHHIMRPDADRDLHDHPWNARTIILRGSYLEQRLLDVDEHAQITRRLDGTVQPTVFLLRRPGETAQLRHGEYHRIDDVSAGGVYTLFITSKWRGDWGFLVNGIKVPWRTYTNTDD